MKGLSTELKVGFFAIIVIAILSFMTFRVGGLEWIKKEGYIVYVYFDNIAGLDKKTKVKVAGVDAGAIEDIELKDGKAKLTLRIDKDVQIFNNANASIKATGLLGDKYLSIETGSLEPILKEGGTIENVTEIVDIDEMVRNLSKVSANIDSLTTALNEVLGTEDGKRSLKDTIGNLKDITKNLKEAIAINDEKMRTVLDNINTTTASLKEILDENREPLATTLTNIKEFSDTLKTEGPDLIADISKAAKELKTMMEENKASVKNTTESVENIVQKIEKGEGTIGKLVQDERLYDSINKAVEGVNKTISSIERFRTFITFQAEYLTQPEDMKGYFYVTLQPKQDKYYILGIVKDPVGSVTTTETITTTSTGTTRVTEDKIEEKIEFTAQFAKRYKDVALRLGLTENTFGIGGDLFFNNDKGKVTADIWDFSNDEEDSENPHVKIGIDYFLFKNLFISAGVDNVLNEKWLGGYAGAGLRFEDEDLKYLFGNMPAIAVQ
ncbi:MAG: MlaD family protein [Nitrospirota bacterium]